MVIRLILRASILAFVLLTIGCGSTSVSQVAGPDPVRCAVSLATAPTMPAAGGRAELALTTERECGWTASSDATWLQVSPASGQGEMAVTVTAGANAQAAARTGGLTINGTRYTVTQAPAPCTFSVSPAAIATGASGGTATTRVDTLSGCSWATASAVAWVQVTPASASGSGTVTLTVDANPATSERVATVTVAGTDVTVTQAGASPAPAPGPAPSPSPLPGPSPSPSPSPSPQCSYDLDPYVRTVGDKGGDKTVKIITTAGCAWTAVPNVPWIQIKDHPSGTGTKDVKYHVDENRNDAGRVGTITVGGRTHTVLQDGRK